MTDFTARIQALHQQLDNYYGAPPPRPARDPLAELVQTILSQNTSDVNSDRAYASLCDRYDEDWEAVRSAPLDELADAIRMGGLPNIKAKRIQAVLNQIGEQRGDLDLRFLRDRSLEEGRAFLRGLDGVGPKTAACVLLFSCGKPAFPVDTHVHRVSVRLGLAAPKATAEQAHQVLESSVPADLAYAFHMDLIRHGREICKAQRPRCAACPVAHLCEFPGKG